MKAGQFLRWQDLFAIVDDGSLPLARYDAIELAMREHAKQHAEGIVCMVILPPDSRPPPDDVKRAVKTLLTRMAPQISCLAYVIEGSGFKAVAVRAALVGMKIFSSRPYPIYVETSLSDAIRKVMPHLPMGKMVTSDVGVITKTIADARAAPA